MRHFMRLAKRLGLWATMVALVTVAGTNRAAAGPGRTVEFRFTPTARTQIALWIERPDGTFMGTVRLTQAVSVRGIGNRPGASQMNSAYRWPYGRREGVLPIWAHRRAAVADAKQFKRVIFQDRVLPDGTSGEGLASRLTVDSSPEPYFCLSFMMSAGRREALDAITCATTRQPETDKGRYIVAADVAKGYSEPIETDGVGSMRPLDLVSLYPPRRDVVPCATPCVDRPDVSNYPQDARDVMPDIDAVTMATPAADAEQFVLFSIPDHWDDGDYVAWIEVNVEGDYNDSFGGERLRTPQTPTGGAWDWWALNTGYPYRGQPSVAFSTKFTLGAPATFATRDATGYGEVDGFGATGGTLHPMDGLITDAPDDPATQGSGADRLRLAATRDYRFQVNVRDVGPCALPMPPGTPVAMTAVADGDPKHSHQWGNLHFIIPASQRPLDRYEVRYSTNPIVAGDPVTFDRALPAMAAQVDSVGLTVPTSDTAGTGIDVRFGGMDPLTHYYVAIRAVDSCNHVGPFAVAELTTTRINFTQLSGCFIATAAYGSAMEPEVQALRALRDTLRPRSALFAVATDLYYRSGPAAAAVIARSDLARAVVRGALAAAVDAARVGALLADTRNP